MRFSAPTFSGRARLIGAGTLMLSALLLVLALSTSGGNSAAAKSLPPTVPSSAQPQASLTPCAGIYAFRQIPSPNVEPTGQNYIFGVDALSTTDAWAVGQTWSGFGSYHTFTARWNGTQWTQVASPDPGYDPVLRDVETLAANNAWAVGSAGTSAFILRWNGTAWNEVPLPDFGSDYTALYGISAADANNIWAVGRRWGVTYSTLVLHWNGVEWTEELSGRIQGPPGYTTLFRNVAVAGPNDVWAVGSIHENGSSALTARWNGSTWQRVAAPNPSNSSSLRDVAVTPNGTVWTVGSYYGAGARNHTLVMRWTGSAWEIVTAPDPTGPEGPTGGTPRQKTPLEPEPLGGGGGDPCQGGVCDGNFLMGISAAADNEVWAVGSSDRFNFTRTNAFGIRWDGSQWTEVQADQPSPNFYQRLYDVTAPEQGRAWAVGTYLSDNQPYTLSTLIEEYDANFCATPTPTAAVATATPCTGSPEWVRLTGPVAPQGYNEIKSIGVVSENDIWAVGDFSNAGKIAHWNGSSWEIMPTTFVGELQDIAVISANDIWAVGTNGGNPNSAVTAHYDGTSWRRIEIGIYGSGDVLYTVAGTASNNVWAAGQSNDGLLFMRWDGTRWNRSPVQYEGPGKGASPDYSYDYVYDIAVVNSSEMWAVGTIRIGGAWRSLIMRWDPQNGWNFSSAPSPGLYLNNLRSIDVVAPNDIWAAGYTRNTYEEPNRTLTLRYNGTSWSVVPSPNPTLPERSGESPNLDYDGNFLYGVDAVSANEVWAVGTSAQSGGTRSNTLTMRWDGSAWNVVASPNFRNRNELFDVAALAPSYVWAAGFEGINYPTESLVMRYGPPCNATPLPTNTAAPTNTPRIPTATRTVPTSTPTPVVPTFTPIPCNVFQPLVEGFENGGTLGPRFASTVVGCNGGVCGWGATTQYRRSGSFSANAPGSAYQGEQRLTQTTPVAVPSGALNVTLDFWHITQFYDGDGGVLEVSTDGGTNWADAGSNILVGGYDGTLSGSGNPLAGRQGWTDYTNEFSLVSVNLLPYAGQSILIRYRLGTNNSIGTQGWFIDDISLSIGLSGGCLTPTSTPQGGATSTTGVPPTSTVANTRTPTPVPTCGPSWQYRASPNPPGGNARLTGVDASSPLNVWAVGHIGGTTPIAMQWNGITWTTALMPPFSYAGLEAVSVLSLNQAFAVGYENRGGYYQPLAMRYNGLVWTPMPTPGFPSVHGHLRDVVALAANDVWAVGDGPNGPLIMHYDGVEWTISLNGLAGEGPSRYRAGEAGSPGSYYDALFGVDASGPNNVWAVGTNNNTTLTLRWNGSTWTQVVSPNTSNENVLNDVEVLSENEVYAVGHEDFYLSPDGAIALRWNGTQWSVSNVPAGDLGLFGVEAISPGNIWAVGIEYLDQWHFDSVLLNWNGSAWVRTASPNPTNADRDELYAVTGTGNGEGWAVGFMDFGTLTDRYFNPCTTATVSVPTITVTNIVPTGIPGTPVPTSTNNPAASPTPPASTSTSTAVATAQACAIEFSDVPEGSTFYPYVRCLSCQGVLGGYADGTFRPNNPITRGQLAKVVANAAGLNNPVSGQTFEDVPENAPFYAFIERMYRRGYVSGYGCGGASEPCGPQNRPYFRPNNSANRGQISKIVANSAQLVGAGDVPQDQMFEDVQPDSTFYMYVQALGTRGFMGGYPCGSEGEPCGPENNPYFRPFNTATRGQSAKIISNTFFPTCATR